MTNKASKLILAAAMTAMVLTSGTAQAQQTPLCTPGGISVGFFNGVWNTRAQAQSGREALSRLYGDTYQATGEAISYDLYYNDTGSNHGATPVEDLIETFKQRAAEQDGVLQQRFELFWEALSGDGQQTTFTRVLSTIGALGNVLSGLFDDLRAKAVAALTSWASNPPTLANYQEQQTRVDNHLASHQKLVFVAHSQGNLFMNAAYAYATGKVGQNAVKAVHVAPASPMLNGEYSLANLDLVINALRLIGTVPANNVEIPATGRDDLSGHTLIGTYLNQALKTYPMVKTEVGNALSAVQYPQLPGVDGFFTVTLTWDGSGDVDLHTFEPGGTHVYYGASHGLSGTLDVDNTVGFGPEHYTSTCDGRQLQTGTYNIGINDYLAAEGRTATIQVSSYNDGLLLTRSVPVGPARGGMGNSSPIPVATVQVTKDASGNFSVSAQ